MLSAFNQSSKTRAVNTTLKNLVESNMQLRPQCCSTNQIPIYVSELAKTAAITCFDKCDDGVAFWAAIVLKTAIPSGWRGTIAQYRSPMTSLEPLHCSKTAVSGTVNNTLPGNNVARCMITEATKSLMAAGGSCLTQSFTSTHNAGLAHEGFHIIEIHDAHKAMTFHTKPSTP